MNLNCPTVVARPQPTAQIPQSTSRMAINFFALQWWAKCPPGI